MLPTLTTCMRNDGLRKDISFASEYMLNRYLTYLYEMKNLTTQSTNASMNGTKACIRNDRLQRDISFASESLFNSYQ